MKAIEALAMVGGYVNEELLVRNEFLSAENEILKSKIDNPIKSSDDERIRLARIGKRLGLKALKDLPCIVKPETILKWFHELVAKKFDGSKNRKACGRPKTDPEIKKFIIQLAENNPGWGYDRIADVLAACDFFTTEVMTLTGLVTYYILFFILVGSRKVLIAGITTNPNEAWMNQIARNITMDGCGFLSGCKYLILDWDAKYSESFRDIIESSGIKIIRLPPRSPNLNAFAERFVRSIKEECLSKLLLFGESALRTAVKEYVVHYHGERNHQGKDHIILFPNKTYHPDPDFGPIQRNKRLGDLLNYYYREAA